MEKKTKKKWLPVLLVALAVLLVGGTAAGLWLGGVFEKADGENAQDALYWNLEHDLYVASGVDLTSGRMARGGIYYITFGCNGEKVELPCADKLLVDRIDMLEVMGLELDENGYIVGVKTPAQCGYTQFSGSLYVTGVEGNTIHTNNSATGRGLSVDLTVTDKTQIYDVTGGQLMGYVSCQPEKDDELVVVKDRNGDVSHIFVKPLSELGDVYWNIDRQYDSTTQMTTRTPDALGYYTYELLLDGQLVTLKTRDMKVANDIDKSLAMGLEFDEEGLITKKVSSKVRTGGGVVGSYYDVMAIEGNMVTVERTYSTNIGKVVEFTMRADCKVYDVSDSATVPGERTELRLGDRVQTLTDDRGMACLIFVVANRPLEGAKIGWNIDRKWDSTNKVSTRKMSKDGLYHIEMAIGGQLVDVKTDNIEYVNKIDSFVCYGVKLDENNMVQKVTKAQYIYNRGTFASYYFITKIEDGVITAEKDGGLIQTMKMGPDCVTYDVSQNANYSGEVTTPQVGDKIHGFPDANGIRELYVVSRPWDVTVYWNIDRQYDSKKKETKRVPDEDGYYWFEIAGNGKQYTLKTRSKEIANGIDSSATHCKAFVHWNGEITKLIGIANTKNYSGSTQGISYVWVTEVNGNVIKCENRDPDSANYGKIYTVNLSKYCKVYNVDPDGHTKFIGEPTTVQVGDKIQGYHNANNLMTLIYVVDGRTAPLDTTPNTCPCEASAKWEPWDGTTELKNGKSYYLTANVEAPAEGFVIEGMRVNLRLDGHTISSQGRCFWIKTGGKLNICDHDTRGKLVGGGVAGESGGVIRLYTSSGTAVNLWNIDVESTDANSAKEGGIASVSGPMTAHNCNFIGGKVSNKGGSMQVSAGGTFRAFDSSIRGGTADTKGGNLNVQGRIYLENTTITGGKSEQGANINMESSLECVLKDVTVTAASGQNNIYLTKGQLDVTGKITVTGGTGYNVKVGDGKFGDAGMTAGSSIGVTADAACTVMVNTTEDKLSCFTLEHFSDQRIVYADGAIVIEEYLVLKEHTDHCLCAGQTVPGHSCATVTGWQPLTKDLLEETTGTGSSVVGVKLIQSGKYYLPRDLELSQALVIPDDMDVTICLNGCDITSSARVALVAGKLTITDCGGGKVTGGSASNGGCIKVLNGGTLNIYGGTYTDSKAVTSGGGGVIGVSTDAGNVVSNSTKKTTTFNMYGGTITGGSAASHGGCVGTYTGDCVFNMYGGTITGGTSKVGGNVSVSGPAKLLGGTITGGSGTSGNDVGLRSNCQLTIGGNVTIGQIYIASGKTIKVNSDLNPTAPIGIVVADGAGVFATEVATDMTGCFKVPEGCGISYNAADKTMSLTVAAHAKHCACNGADLGLASHSCTQISNWMPLTEDLLTDYTGTNDKVVGKAIPEGNYYLPGDLSLTGALVIPEGMDVTICLNGCDITSTARVAYVAGTLTFTDCAGGGKVTGASSSNGGCIKVLNGGTLNIYGGTFTDSKKVSSGGGGVIGVSTDAGNIVDNATKKTTTFNLYGGTITGGSAASHGGCVGTYTGDCVFNMYGGTVKGGSSKVGGNVSVSGPAKLLGGTITGGSGTSGNDVGLRSNCQLTIGGNIAIGDIYIPSGKTIAIHSSGLTTATPITILFDDGAGVFATNVVTDLSTLFAAEGKAVTYDEETKTLTIS